MKPEKFDPKEKNDKSETREPLAKKIETCETQKSPKKSLRDPSKKLP